MFDQLLQLLSRYSGLLTAASFVVSLLTLFTMMMFKRRIRIEFDKKQFENQKRKILKELDGFEGSLFDGLYTTDFLRKIDILLSEIPMAYTCLSRKTRLYTNYVVLFLNYVCFKEAQSGSNKSCQKLNKKLRRISILLKREIL